MEREILGSVLIPPPCVGSLWLFLSLRSTHPKEDSLSFFILYKLTSEARTRTITPNEEENYLPWQAFINWSLTCELVGSITFPCCSD